MRAKYGSETIHVIHNGVNLPPDAVSKPPDIHPLRFMFAGRLDPEKGLHFAIESFVALKQSHPEMDYVFDIYGGGDDDYVNQCRQTVLDHGLSERIRFMGKVRGLGSAYLEHDVFLMPTNWREPAGLVLMEAMSCYLATVSFNHYGPSEIITHGKDGILVTPGSVSELTDAIYQLYTNPQLRYHLGVAGRKTVEEKFNLYKNKEKVEEILKQIAGKE
jgi:glycosyltransferase involved in cell wall biosynthesis